LPNHGCSTLSVHNSALLHQRKSLSTTKLPATGHVGADCTFELYQHELRVMTKREFELLRHMPEQEFIDTSKMLLSPMPGAVISIAVQPGDKASGMTML